MAKPLYSTSFNISGFQGLNQTGDGYNMDMRYAREIENVNILGGSFQPMREGHRIEQTLHDPIGTLAYLHRRWGTNTGTLLIAISNGRVFTKALDGSDDWVQRFPEIVNTAGVGEDPVYEEAGDPLAVSDNDWVTYEISLYPDFSDEATYVKGQRVQYRAEDTDPWKNYRARADIETAGDWGGSTDWEELEGTDPVDILLFSNATDGMYCLYGDTLDVVPVVTPKKFGVLARYNERVWGAGITDDPDMLVYSVPYDPFDWSQNDEIPEDGAGDIQQPTWDGDSFVSLKQYGNTLLAIKRNSIWRISGTNPGEFTMQQQYGGGTIAENTVAVYNDYAWMMGEYGMMQYNGSGAFPFNQEAMQILMREQLSRKYEAMPYSENRSYAEGELCKHSGAIYRCKEAITVEVDDGELVGEEWTAAHWEAVTGTPLDNVCAGMWNGTYCLALPINGSPYCNAILQYDTLHHTFTLRTGVAVESFLQINERLFYTSADYPGTVCELDDNQGEAKAVRWVTGYQDLGQKSSIKSAFIVYMMVEAEVPVELKLGLRTEKKLKEKIVTVKPGKLLRAHLNTQGRVFRLEIQSMTAAPYIIAGGIKVDLELDPD